MKSKTLNLINGYLKIIKEQGEMPDMSQEQPPAPQEDAQAEPESTAPREIIMPFTSEQQNQYIEYIVNAAKFKPSPQQYNTLENYRVLLDNKLVKNAEEEILTPVLAMISNIDTADDLSDKLNEIN